MADLTTTHLSSSFTHPLIPLQPQVAFKNITHFMPSQKCCNGSFSTHFQLQRTFARPHKHSKIASVNFIVCGLATGFSHLHYEEDNSMQPGGGGDEENEETKSTPNAETSLVLATPDDGKEASLAGLSVLEAPIFTTDTLQTGGTDKLSSDDIEAQKERRMRKKTQQLTYLFAAVASSVGITSLAGASVYCRFAWQMQGEVPWTEMCGTFSLALGAAVGMEYWARWAHRVLWHASLWSMHESHHQPRDGPFELNDVFAIINAVPAIALMAFGFLNKGLVPGLCFGAGLGITMFGIAYMFVHDGLVHRRFPVGPIADVPYFQKVAAAHQLHHADKFNGVPYGLFLGPMELEEVGGRTELEKLFQKRKRENKNPINS